MVLAQQTGPLEPGVAWNPGWDQQARSLLARCRLAAELSARQAAAGIGIGAEIGANSDFQRAISHCYIHCRSRYLLVPPRLHLQAREVYLLLLVPLCCLPGDCKAGTARRWDCPPCCYSKWEASLRCS